MTNIHKLVDVWHYALQQERAARLALTIALYEHPDGDHLWNRLAPRECQIFIFRTAGLTNKEVAQYLRISESTVKKAVSKLMHKLQIQVSNGSRNGFKKFLLRMNEPEKGDVENEKTVIRIRRTTRPAA